MRRLTSAASACLMACLIAAPGAGARATPRIVGGTPSPINQTPWTVAVGINDGDGISPRCGGAILDASHVVTAAHCVLDDIDDPESDVLDPEDLAVISGSATIYPTLGPSGVISDVTVVEPHPDYDGDNYDLAVLTVAPPLQLDGINRKALPLASSQPSVGDFMTISGWGVTNEDSVNFSPDLRSTTVRVKDFETCRHNYAAVGTHLRRYAEICAGGGNPPRDTCYGDSGGPLVDNQGQLAGIVSAGTGCAEPKYPGIYSSIANTKNHAFLMAQMSPAEPPPTVGPRAVLTGIPRAGETLKCTPGTGSGAGPYIFDFVDRQPENKNNPVIDLQNSENDTYALTTVDIGRTISCRVRSDGYDFPPGLESNGLGPVVPPEAPPPPITLDAPEDAIPPTSRVIAHRCTTSIRCVIDVLVSDRGFTVGIHGVRATVRNVVSRPCVRNGRRAICSQVRASPRLAVVHTGRRRYEVIANKLPYGTHTFSLFAVDRAGNIQKKATHLVIVTRKPRRR